MSNVISRRFRCAACGLTRASDEPELEPGFRLTVEAADALTRMSIDMGISNTARMSGIDKGTISRLIRSRYIARLTETPRPLHAHLSAMADAGFCVADAATGKPVAFFSKTDEPRMVEWLSDPEPMVVITDAICLPKAINWKRDFTVGLSSASMNELLGSPLRLSSMRMARHIGTARHLRGAVADMLLDEFASSEVPDDLRKNIFKPGAPARHFVRLRDGIRNLQLSASVSEGMRSIDQWLQCLEGVWQGIFSPITGVLETYRPHLFSHPATVTCCPVSAQYFRTASPTLLTLREAMI